VHARARLRLKQADRSHQTGPTKRPMALAALLREHGHMARFTNLLCCVLITSSAELASHAAASSETPSQSSCASTSRLAARVEEELEVWIDLSVPSLSTQSAQNREARAALRARIEKQQDEVMSQLAALGATETARVMEVRNSIAVRIPPSALTQARALPGVIKVRAVKHRQRISA
jgi:hypothetical protein